VRERHKGKDSLTRGTVIHPKKGDRPALKIVLIELRSPTILTIFPDLTA